MEVETERLLLRDFLTADFEAFYRTTNDPEYQRFYAEQEMTREFWRELFDRILASTEEQDRRVFQLAICLKSGVLIGTCGVRLEDVDSQQASFGCAIGRDYWGQGYAVEASRRLIDYAFAELPVHRLYAETISENSQARALAERLEFRLEGLLRDHRYFRARRWDTAVYAVLKEEWLGNQ